MTQITGRAKRVIQDKAVEKVEVDIATIAICWSSLKQLQRQWSDQHIKHHYEQIKLFILSIDSEVAFNDLVMSHLQHQQFTDHADFVSIRLSTHLLAGAIYALCHYDEQLEYRVHVAKEYADKWCS